MHILRHLQRQDGIALVVAVGVLGVLAIAGTTVVLFSTANARSANVSKVGATAYSLAEAGLAEALAVLFNPANNAFNPYLLPARTSTYEGGTVTFSGVLNENSNPPVWTVTSMASAKNPTGASGEVRRTLTAKVKVDPLLTESLGSQAWNYVFSTATGDPSGCDMSLLNTVEMGSPLYVAGNLCLDNSAWISGGPVLVHGQLKLNAPQNSVGTSSAPVNTVKVAGGCTYRSNPLHSPCQGPPANADNVFANEIGTAPATITWPTAEWEKWYLNASPGPYYGCSTQSGTPPTFDNDQGLLSSPDASKWNRSVPGTFNLAPSGSSYQCKTAAGELSWNKGAKKLTVSGTVFIDGNAVIDNGFTSDYDGQGTIYLSGSLLLKNSNLCAVVSGSTCDWAGWNPNTAFVGFIAGGKGGGGQSDVGADVSIEIKSVNFQGGLYGVQKVQIDTAANQPQIQGPMVAPSVVITQAITTYSFPAVTIAPTGLAGNQVVYSKPRAPESFNG
jgi:Tfp pilus assembly protein PilX